jgi:hypothetical protein
MSAALEPVPNAAPPSKSLWRRFTGVGVFCALLAVWGFQPGGGILTLLTVPFVAVWLLVCAVLFITRKWARRDIAIKVTLVLGLLAAIIAWHQRQQMQLSRAAQEYAAKIEQFHRKHKRYPRSLEEVSPPSPTPGKPLRIVYQAPGEGSTQAPSLFFVDAFVFRAAHRYDFATQTWRFSMD